MQRANLAQHAVDAIADTQEALLRLEVDVGRATIDCVREQRGNEAHHGLRIRVARGLEALVVDLPGLDFVQNPVDREIVAVVLVDCPADLAFARESGLERELAAQLRAQLVEGNDVVRVGQRDDQLACLPVERHRKYGMALGELSGHELQGHRVDDNLREIDALQAELLRQGVAQGGLGHEAKIDEQLAHRLVGLELLEKRDPQLILGENPLRDQDLPDMALRLRGDRLGGKARRIHGTGYLLSSCTRVRAWPGSKLAARFSARASARW